MERKQREEFSRQIQKLMYATVVCTLYVMFSEYDFSVDEIHVFLGEINRVNCILIVSALCQLRVKTGVG